MSNEKESKEEKHGNARTTWRETLARIKAQGESYNDQEGRACKELRNVTITITEPQDASELVRDMQRGLPWLYPTPEDLRSVMLGDGGSMHEYSYAPRLFGTHSDPDDINQIEDFLLPLLTKNPQTRRAVLTLYNPLSDSTSEGASTPSLLCIIVRRTPKLELTCIIRSCDAFFGFPANLYQVRALQEYIAERLDVTSGAIHLVCASLHIYPEYEALTEHIIAGKRSQTPRS